MKKIIFIFCLVFLQYGCDKDSTDPDIINNPSIVTLVFPFENSLCNVGTDVTPTESTVLFEWQASANTNSYTLVVKNISTGDSASHQTTNTELAVTIARATQHQWYVISNALPQTAQSAKWSFYNAGEGVQSYAPFPASNMNPPFAVTLATTSQSFVDLSWVGSDIDNDIEGYDVYFGTTTSPEIYVNDQSESQVDNVPIEANTIYYWKVITKDSQGNTSDSGLYQFKNR